MTPPDAQTAEAPATMADLAMLVRRLILSLRKARPESPLAAMATDYLRRKGLQGNPLREGDAQTAAAITKGETNPDVLIVKYGPQIGRGAIRSVLSVTYPPGSPGAAALDLAAAVLEFGERLPGWWWKIEKIEVDYIAECRRARGFDVFCTVQPTPAAALRAVMKQALQAREGVGR